MSFKKEYEKFEASYSENIKDMLVLTSENTGGAGLIAEDIWMPGAGLLASVDMETGEVSREEGRLQWLAESKDRGSWIHNLKSLTIYRVKCRERLKETIPESLAGKSANFYMLVEVAERDVSHPELAEILEDYNRGVEFHDEMCGTFTLDRELSFFEGNIDWLGEECSISLDCDDDNEETAEAALAAFKKIYSNLKVWDEKFRRFAAEKLTDSANDWLQDLEEGEDEPDEITEASFAERICISEFTMSPEGNYSAYYDDDDMFGGHVILVDGNVDTGLEDAYIAG